MLFRFVQQRIPIQKAMIDLSQSDCINDADFSTIKEIVGTLQPVKLAVKTVCRRDTTLLSADAALKFCIVNLENQQYELAKVMASSLHDRVKERRSIAGNLQFLHNRGVPGDEVFTVPSSSAVSKFVHCLLSRMDATFSGRRLCCTVVRIQRTFKISNFNYIMSSRCSIICSTSISSQYFSSVFICIIFTFLGV